MENSEQQSHRVEETVHERFTINDISRNKTSLACLAMGDHHRSFACAVLREPKGSDVFAAAANPNVAQLGRVFTCLFYVQTPIDVITISSASEAGSELSF